MPKKTHAPRFAGPPPAARPAGANDQRNLAEATRLLRAGQPERAAELCDALLLLQPRHPEALHLGGIIAMRLRRLDQAIDRLRRAAMLQPHNPAVLSDLGVALEMAGKRADAETAYRAALALDPGYADALLNLGRLLVALARDNEAADCYVAVLARRPDLPEAHNKLAQIRLGLRMPLEALAGAERALALRPDMVEALQTLGSALDVLGRYDEAVAARERAISLRPKAGGGDYDLGMTQLHHGRLKEAEVSFRQAIGLEPGRGAWHQALAHLIGHKRRDADIEAMVRLHDDANASSIDRMHVAFGLGKALDDIGAVRRSLRLFPRSQPAQAGTPALQQRRDRPAVRQDQGGVHPGALGAHAGAGAPDRTPIFVLGMPRSGTSLVEQMMASHPDVQAAASSASQPARRLDRRWSRLSARRSPRPHR